MLKLKYAITTLVSVEREKTKLNALRKIPIPKKKKNKIDSVIDALLYRIYLRFISFF